MTAAIVVVVLTLFAADRFGLLSTRTPRTPALAPGIWIALLVGSYAAQLAIVWYAALHQSPTMPYRALMPIAVVVDRGLVMENADLVSAGMLALAAVQSYALLALYRAKPARALVWAACAAMFALSFVAPAMTSFDLYSYVYDALRGVAAYNPPAIAFTGEYHVFDLWWGGAMTYGPLWPLVARLATFAAPALLWKLLALRGLGIAAYVAFLVGLKALGMPARIRTVAALNAGMMLQYVADGHNDLVAIALLTCAAATMSAGIAGPALVAVAGLVKIPYLVLGLPLLAAIRPVWSRWMTAGAVVAIAIAGSWFGGGAAYVAAVTAHVAAGAPGLLQYVAAACALAAIAFALAGQRRLRAAVWLIPTLGTWIFAWYVGWGLPYALARRRILGYLLVFFPLVAMLLEAPFARWWTIFLILPAVAIACLLPARRAAVRA